MQDARKILFLFDFNPAGDKVAEILKHSIEEATGLPVETYGKRFHPPNNLWNKWRLALGTAFLAVRALPRARAAKHVICWNQNVGIPLCFLLRMTPWGPRPKVYLFGTAITALRRRFPVRNLIDFALGYDGLAAYISFTQRETQDAPKIFGNLARVERHAIALANDLPDDAQCESQTPPEDGEYFVSGGRSNRRYSFLISFFEKNPEYRYVIICDNLAEKTDAANIKILKNTYGREYFRYMRFSRAILLDLMRKDVAAGITVFIHALALGVPIIMTRSEIAELYAIDGKNCILIDDDEEQLKAALERVRDDEVWAEISSFQKRDHAERFSTAALGRKLASLIKD
jgi:glycosyltransferase involved in cell wall biosynthesis